jgi:putative PIN family toxin of toxin-antitoxin system
MARRKDRVLILLDTNALARGLIHPYAQSPSARILDLWRQRRIQLAVSRQLAQEYLEILDRLGVDPGRVRQFAERLTRRETVTFVNLGRRLRVARDPEDDMILSTADSAKVEYLVTLDKDLLELTLSEKQRLKFEIVTPPEFLDLIQ